MDALKVVWKRDFVIPAGTRYVCGGEGDAPNTHRKLSIFCDAEDCESLFSQWFGIIEDFPELEHVIPPRRISHAAEWTAVSEAIPDDDRIVAGSIGHETFKRRWVDGVESMMALSTWKPVTGRRDVCPARQWIDFKTDGDEQE